MIKSDCFSAPNKINWLNKENDGPIKDPFDRELLIKFECETSKHFVSEWGLTILSHSYIKEINRSGVKLSVVAKCRKTNDK